MDLDDTTIEDIKAIDAEKDRAFEKSFKRFKAQESVHHDVISQKELARAYEKQARPALLAARISAVKTTMETVDWLKPIIFVGLGLILILGPGLTAIQVIFQSIQWWWWTVAIVIILIAWRNY